MRSNKGQFVKGTTGNPNGRPKRADEQFLMDLWDVHGKAKFSEAVSNGEKWALKTLVDKLYPNQKPMEYQSDNFLPQPLLSGVIISVRKD